MDDSRLIRAATVRERGGAGSGEERGADWRFAPDQSRDREGAGRGLAIVDCGMSIAVFVGWAPPTKIL